MPLVTLPGNSVQDSTNSQNPIVSSVSEPQNPTYQGPTVEVNPPQVINTVQNNTPSIPENHGVIETKGPDFANKPVSVPQFSNPLPTNPGATVDVMRPNLNGAAVGLQSKFSPEKNDIWTYLDLTEVRGASDLHFTVGYPPLLRIDGKLNRVGSENLTEQSAEKIFRGFITSEQWERLSKERELDMSIQHKTGSRFRVNLYFERGNIAGVLRLIPAKIKTVSELGLPPVLNDLAKLPHGLILVTGPTGSGKSTTIAAMINEINVNEEKHILTVEDPIEYMYGKGKALVDQRELGRDTLSWSNALKYALRQDPDVVLVGEMRDYETIAAAITVAETGHLVFATLHTNSASQSIDRIVDVFPEHQQAQVSMQLANVLQAVLSQRLIPMIGGGRMAAIELMVGTSAVKNAIREGKTYQIDNMIQTSSEAGMVTLEKSLAEMNKKGKITLETALEFTTKPSELRNLLGVY